MIITGQLLSEVRHLDKEISNNLLGIIKTSTGDKCSPFSNFKILLLDETGRKEFDILCKSLQEGTEIFKYINCIHRHP